MIRAERDERGEISVGTMILFGAVLVLVLGMLVDGEFLRTAGDRAERVARRAARAAAMRIDERTYLATGEVTTDWAAAREAARAKAESAGHRLDDLYPAKDRRGRDIVVAKVSRPAPAPVTGTIFRSGPVTVHRRGGARLEDAR